MKKTTIILIFSIITFLGKAQDTGIRFEGGQSWEQVKAKARAEHKHIFVDCYATWCGPCKQMDKVVYPAKEVGDYMNSAYLSVKLQFDKTAKDNNEVKSWYRTAAAFQKDYKILAYPTFLFFNDQGELADMQTGFQTQEKFLEMARTAALPGKLYNDPYKGYDQFKANYAAGKKDYSNMAAMIRDAIKLQEKEFETQLVKDYGNYLKKLPASQLYTRDHISFIGHNIKPLKREYFSLFYNNGKKVDVVMKNPGYASRVIDTLIRKEEVNEFLKTYEGKPEPNWNELEQTIQKHYQGNYAERNALWARIHWYQFYRNMPEYLKYSVLSIQKFGTDTTDIYVDNDLNTLAWDIFLNSENKDQLNAAIAWMPGVERRFERQPGPVFRLMDTYANLIYKSAKLFHTRRENEAIQWEKKAEQNALKWQDPDVAGVRDIIDKMQKGEPTWPDQKPTTQK